MRLNAAGEVPVLIHGENIICDATQIIDYLEETFVNEKTPRLMPEEGSMYYPRVQHYRELLDSLPMDAYTHGCILHPELAVDSMIPAYATTRIRKNGHQPWLCGEFFSLADISLAVTLHRLKFIGLARRSWGNGKRPNLEIYYERVLKRKTFHKVLGHVNNILISAVLPTAFRVAKKKAPRIFGTTLLVGVVAGIGYFAFVCLQKRFANMLLSIRARHSYL
ncbi:PREDICTED: ganglioside-induced differentiation-associated protein 1 isoform X2 [Gekko japonicus]|uniref:Ganglioside-induced differentiation-associated protein 1 isoform X2 n=1 Tax=Gekko japonicus TaxID=146911 RepID=A0ABM1KDA3_GEKJA|nr:PREDICTED: ganglioside-induced differentiation-associated protein 1 isoform X2 [Gekko japonicus]